MIPVLDYQITYLLSRLRDSLRGDDLLCRWLDASPDQIVRGTYRVQPVYEEDGQVKVDTTQLPCIAAVILASEPHYGFVDSGQTESLQLWYVFDTPADDRTGSGIAISGPEKAETWKRCVWDRVCYFLRTDSTYTDPDIGKIDSLEIGKASFFPAGHAFGGFKADLTMVRTLAPMATDALKELQTISIDMGSGVTETVPTGPKVEAEITVHA